MKKILYGLLTAVMLFSVAGCSSKSKSTSDSSSQLEEESSIHSQEAQIDVDLTELSSTMVYSEVYTMMTEPESYSGKTVKMTGTFDVYHDDETGKDYFACLISDATACCSQGIEFVLEGDYKYPDDYPEIDSKITVMGTFDSYKEDKYTYCQLLNAKLVK